MYIIALGTNDVRYREPSICAMNPKEYIFQIKQIVEFSKNHKTRFIFIAPWFSTSDDHISRLNHLDKQKLTKEYSLELENFAKANNHTYIDPNDYLERIILNNKKKYMVDHIHPNNNDGIMLYCEGIFFNSQ